MARGATHDIPARDEFGENQAGGCGPLMLRTERRPMMQFLFDARVSDRQPTLA